MPASKIDIILEAYDRMTAPINNAVNKAQSKLTSFAQKSDRLANKAYHSGKEMTVAGFAVAAPLYKAFEAASEFETKMVDIGKQLNAKDSQEYASKMANMTKQVMSLGHELPLATADIQDMIASSLRMGVAEDKVVGFTKEVTKMAVAFDMPAGEIADSMGKLSNVFKIPVEKIGDFADAINYLDDKTVAKGPEIIDVLQRVGGSAKALEANDAAALASTMLSLGESSSTAGTGINAMLNRLGAATMQSKRFQEGMHMLGLSSADIQKKMSDKSTAKNAILEVFKKIQGLKPEKQTEALVRLFGAEHGPKLAKLANNVEAFRKQLEMVQGAQKGSMDKEYQRRIETSAAQMQIFKNRINELWVKVGTNLLPTVNKIIIKLGVWLDKIGKFIDKHPQLVQWILKAAMVFSALALAGGYLSFVVSGVSRLFNIVTVGARGFSKVVGFLTDKKKGLSHWIFVARYRMLQFQQFATGKALPAIKQFGSYVGGGFKNAFNTASQFVTGKALPALRKCASYVGGAFSSAIKVGTTTFKLLGAAFKTNPIGFVLTAIALVAGVVFGFLVKKFGSVRGALNALGSFFKKVGRILFAPFIAGIDWVKSKIDWVMDKINAFKKIINSVGNFLSRIFGGGGSKNKESVKKVEETTQEIRDHLPSSPAKKGPLKDINKVDLFGTIAKTMQVAPMMRVVKGVTGGVFGFLKKSFLGPTQAVGGGAAAMTANFTINLNGGATKQDAQLLRKEIEKCIIDLQKKQARVSFA